MISMTKSVIPAMLVSILWASGAMAHHSAAQFDFTHMVTVQGTVKSFHVTNPHTAAVIEVTDAKGTRDVEYEGHSASNFYRAGYTKDAVKFGDHVSILIAPRRDGKDGGFISAFTTASGQVIGFGGLSPSTGKAEEKAPAGPAATPAAKTGP
jgi:Family of unknown function (DUF6152)